MCAQLGITVCSTSLGLVAEPAIAYGISGPFEALGVHPAWTHPIAFVVAIVVVVYRHAVLGEMVPKNLAVAGPDRAVLLFGPPLEWLGRPVRPVIAALSWLANYPVRLFGVEPRDEVASSFTAEEVQSIVERSAAMVLISDEQGLLSGALEFSDRTAAEVMVPAAGLVTVDAGATPDDVERAVARTGERQPPGGQPLHALRRAHADAGRRRRRARPAPRGVRLPVRRGHVPLVGLPHARPAVLGQATEGRPGHHAGQVQPRLGLGTPRAW